MTMVSIPPIIIGIHKTLQFGSNTLLDGANERVGHCGFFTTPDGATRHITHICWNTGTVTTGDDIICTIESIDAATGLPNGVIAAGRTGTQTVANTDDNVCFETELGTHWDMTSGQWLAITFKMTNGSKSMQIIKTMVLGNTGHSYNWVCEDITGAATWVKTTYQTNVALKCDTGEYLVPLDGDCMLLNSNNSISTGTNPRYQGNRITCLGKTRLIGFTTGYMDIDYNISVSLCDANGTVIVGDDAVTNMTVAIDADYRNTTAATYGSFCNFPCPKTLLAGTAYYLVFSPDTSSAQGAYWTKYGNATLKNNSLGIPTGWTCDMFTATTNWDNVDHVTVTAAQITGLYPIYDQIDFPAVANVRDNDTVNGATGTLVTRTLSAANDTVAAGYYAATTLSAVDADLVVANIKSGVTIFGLAGETAGGGGGVNMPRTRVGH